MRKSRVPSSAAMDAKSSGPSCPETTVNRLVIPRAVTGMPAAAGTARALVTPGTTVDVDTGGPTGGGLLAAAAQHVGIATLEADDALARPAARSTMRALISSWVSVCACGALPASITSTSGSRSSSSALRGEPVDDDDVGLGEQGPTARGDQAGVAGAAADQGDVSGVPAASVTTQRQRAGVEGRWRWRCAAGRRDVGRRRR